jgi:hypothetical protein
MLDKRMFGTETKGLPEAHNLVALHLDGRTPIGRLDAVQQPDSHIVWLLLHDLAVDVYDLSQLL